MFSVTSSGSRSAISKINSSRCFLVSPIPIIPPVQSSRPAFLAICNVFNLSSYVWVVQISVNLLREASRL